MEQIPPIILNLANGNTVGACYRGYLKVQVGIKIKLLTDTYFIPCLKLNLLSCNRLYDFGTTTTYIEEDVYYPAEKMVIRFMEGEMSSDNGLHYNNTSSKLFKYENLSLRHLEAFHTSYAAISSI